MTVSYADITEGAIIIAYGQHGPGTLVRGIKGITIPSLERSVQEIKELRNDASRSKTGGVRLGTIQYDGNYVVGDPGQDALKAYLRANTSFFDARIYLNVADFLACDMGNDPDVNGWQVSKHSPGKGDVDNPIIPFSGEMVMNGLPALFFIHKTASMGITKTSPCTITCVTQGNDFAADGFVAGMTVIIEGANATGFDGDQFIIKTVAAATLTMEENNTDITALTPASFTLHGGRL